MSALLLEKAAAAAWARYDSAVRTGGTPAQRRWAFDTALAAEEKLAVHERAQPKRLAPVGG